MALFTVFLLSPANLGGERAKLVLGGRGMFPLARQVQSGDGAPLGEVFSFISGLYFRGKLAYAQAFGQPPPRVPGPLVITPSEGLISAQELVTVERLLRWATVDIDAQNPTFVEPLVMHAAALARTFTDRCRFVLLGSVATDKYVEPLGRVLRETLLFPPAFVGRGDMSRGALLLRAARDRQELSYVPVLGAQRQGPRAPGVSPKGLARPQTRRKQG